jgi:hypothetical protein
MRSSGGDCVFFVFVWWSRWGTLVPVFSLVGQLAALLMGRVAAPGALGVLQGLVFAAIAGGGLFIAHRRIQEGSGYVEYDAENDQPVVYAQSSGAWMFIPMIGWAVIFTVAGLAFALIGPITGHGYILRLPTSDDR